ncbi:MAG: hypothetical protein AB1705_27420 [Verrucomicrobiota bacterium]
MMLAAKKLQREIAFINDGSSRNRAERIAGLEGWQARESKCAAAVERPTGGGAVWSSGGVVLNYFCMGLMWI